MRPPFQSAADQRVLDGPDLPTAGFDPLAADAAELERYWLPPRPDPGREPRLYALWQRLLGGRPSFVEARSRRHEPEDLRERRLLSTFRRAGPTPVPPRATSRNWSGAFVTAGRGDRFRGVGASWTAPAVSPGDPSDANGLPYRCSIWVGVDGKHGWAGSLPQLGTEHTVAGDGSPGKASFWWQWWVDGGDTLQFYVDGLPLAAGEDVTCLLVLRTPTLARFHFANHARNEVATVAVECDRAASGSTAEWVVERPSSGHLVGGALTAGPLHPMPDFGTASSTGFVGTGHGADGRAREYGLRPSRLISNVQLRTGPRRAAVTGIARRAGDGGPVEVAFVGGLAGAARRGR